MHINTDIFKEVVLFYEGTKKCHKIMNSASLFQGRLSRIGARKSKLQTKSTSIKVARYSFSRSIPPKFERKLRRHKQRIKKIDTTVVLDKDETLL